VLTLNLGPSGCAMIGHSSSSFTLRSSALVRRICTYLCRSPETKKIRIGATNKEFAKTVILIFLICGFFAGTHRTAVDGRKSQASDSLDSPHLKMRLIVALLVFAFVGTYIVVDFVLQNAQFFLYVYISAIEGMFVACNRILKAEGISAHF